MRDPFWLALGALVLAIAVAGAAIVLNNLRHARRWAEEDRRARRRLEDETVIAFTGRHRRSGRP